MARPRAARRLPSCHSLRMAAASYLLVLEAIVQRVEPGIGGHPSAAMARAATMLCLLASLCGRAAADGKTTLILLNHESHSGSHAVCQALGKLGCVEGFCGQEFVFGPMPEQLLELLRASRRRFIIAIVTFGNGHTNGWDVKSLVAHSNLVREGRLRVVTHIRTDLMRWALSEYCKTGHVADCFEDSDPQFHKGGATAERHAYNLPALEDVAAQLRKRWLAQAEATKLVAASNSSLATLSFYEDFLRAGEAAYSAWLYRWLVDGHHSGRSSSEDAACAFEDAASTGVTKFHSDDISTFVENDGEVRDLFASDRFGSWEAVAWGAGIESAEWRWGEDGPLACSPRPATASATAVCGCSKWCRANSREKHCLHDGCKSCGACEELGCGPLLLAKQSSASPALPATCPPHPPAPSPSAPPAPPQPPPMVRRAPPPAAQQQPGGSYGTYVPPRAALTWPDVLADEGEGAATTPGSRPANVVPSPRTPASAAEWATRLQPWNSPVGAAAALSAMCVAALLWRRRRARDWPPEGTTQLEMLDDAVGDLTSDAEAPDWAEETSGSVQIGGPEREPRVPSALVRVALD